MPIWEGIWDVVWLFFWSFAFVAYLIALFSVIADLFKDHELSGWGKAVWIVFLIFVPFLTVIVYLIARGSGMAERSERAHRAAQAASDDYYSGVVPPSAADEIAKARALLDSGSINTEEFAKLKARALA